MTIACSRRVANLRTKNVNGWIAQVPSTGHQYVKALNPDWPDRIIKINEDATICGVVVFKGEVV